MLELPDYSPRLVLGLVASIGKMTESLIKYASASMFQFLRSHPTHVPRICQEIVDVFQQHLLEKRIAHPMLNFLDLIISSGIQKIFRCIEIEVLI